MGRAAPALGSWVAGGGARLHLALALGSTQVQNAAVLYTPGAVTSTATSAAAVDVMAAKRAWQWCPVPTVKAVLKYLQGVEMMLSVLLYYAYG